MRRTLAFVAGATAAALVAGAALAHTSIAESDPADQSTVEALPGEVSIRFGSPDVPAPQPAQISDATMVLLDACGTRVDNEDASLDQTTSTLTATTKPSEKSGRYEMQWSGTAADGEAQSGLVDFVVSGGSPCTSVVRTDPADDVDAGFDPVKVVSKPLDTGAAVTVTVTDPLTCGALETETGQLLGMDMDTNWDDGVDYSGSFTCRIKKVRRNGVVRKVQVYGLAVTKAGDEAPSMKLKVRKTGRAALTASIPFSIVDEGGSLDLHVSASTESEECEEGSTCADRAPDLGWVRAF